jgi:cytoskeletal protein RodZ
VIGVAVLIVAIIALRNPKHTATTAGSDTRTSTPSATAPLSAPQSRAPSTSTSTSKSTSTSSAPSSTTPTTSSAIGSLPLVVLNDTTTANLARDAAQRFEGGGWDVTSYDENYQNDIISTVAYFDPNVAGAKRAAKALQRQYPTIQRVVAKFPELPAGPIVVVLTSDYTPG